MTLEPCDTKFLKSLISELWVCNKLVLQPDSIQGFGMSPLNVRVRDILCTR